MAEYEIPNDLHYSTEDEWAREEEGRVTIGITDYAQQQLGDIVFVDLPEVGAIFNQGDPCTGIYDIEAGTVAIRRTDSEGNSILVRLAHAGQTLGYRDYFGGREYTSSAEALRKCTVCLIDSKALHDLLEHNPSLGLRFLERIAKDLESVEESLLQRSTLPIRTRLAHLLLTLKFRYGSADNDGAIKIDLPMQRQDLAALLGTRPETLARAFKAMKMDGVLSSSGRMITIPDLDGLLDEIEPMAG